MTPRPFPLGIALALSLAAVVVTILAVLGRLEGYMTQSRGYALLPVFVPLALVAFVLGWALFDRFQVPRAGGAFSLGLLAGGCIAGTILLWISSGERPLLNRVLFSVFGSPLLLGFWLWIGGILGYAFRQQRALRTVVHP